MSENFQACIREALEMPDAPLEALCERIRTLRQIELCALELPLPKGDKSRLKHRAGPTAGSYS